jgi:hypothetical protein
MAKGRGGGRRAARGRDNYVDEAMTDVAAEVADTSEALDSVGQASRSAAAPPDGLLQRRLDKTTADKEKANAEKEKANAEKEKANAEKEKAIQEKEMLQKQLEEAKAELELAKTNVGGVVNVPITPSSNKVRICISFHFTACA